MWLNNIFQNTSVSTLDKVVGFTERRQKVLAENIANIDTPGYKMRDLNAAQFCSDLQDAIKNHSQVDPSESKIDYDQYILFHDGNNRSIEKQMSLATKNALLHNVSVELLRSRYGLLEKAISLRI